MNDSHRAPDVGYRALLEQIADEVAPLAAQGEPASYIPALAAVPRAFGIALATCDGAVYEAGAARQRFSIQSISKLFTLALALRRVGDALWQRVGREPSGSAFNSLVQLEREQGIPRNPFINAGALVVTDVLCGCFAQPEMAVLQFVRQLVGDPQLDFDDAVARSERQSCDRNAAIAHFIKSFGNLRADVGLVLDCYCRQCAIAMSCAELAQAALFLADGGRGMLAADDVRRINAVMLTCGTYDAAGEFAFRVGMPAKSGVGGGILAVAPGYGAICAWSPGLDRLGNSIAAAAALERFAALSGWSVFAPPV